MEIIFFGGGAYAAAILQKLAEAHHIALVITPPPAAAGRKLKAVLPPAAIAAEEQQLPLTHIIDSAQLRRLCAEYAVVCDYGRMIPSAWLDIVPMLNVHPSLLPRWRGAAPVERAMLAGDRQTGVTIIRLNERLDSGDILAQQRVALPPDAAAAMVYPQLAECGASLLLQVLAAPEEYSPQKQDDALATYARKITAADCRLDFTQSAQQCLRRVLALAPAPGAYFYIGDERMRVLAAQALPETAAAAGTLVAADADIVIACGSGSLQISRVQRAGKKAMSSAEFLRGYALAGRIGEVVNSGGV